MIIDFNLAWNRATERTYDVCICGGGPAGISAARKLAANGKSILLLEGGELEFTQQSQDIYKGKNIGRQYWDVELGRLRFFGGTSNHWSGRCGLLSRIDFEEREYFGLPGWPISRSEAMRFSSEAEDILDISGKDLDPEPYPGNLAAQFEKSGYALSPPTRFLEKYQSEIRTSAAIDCFLNANLVDVHLTDDAAKVVGLTIRGFNGKELTVKANSYVLALGAIENARILLNANRQVSSGLGNQNDMVGRCFMEHLNVSIGRFIVTDAEYWRGGNVDLAPTELMLREKNIGNGILHFETNATPKSAGRLKVLKQFLRETACALPDLAGLTRKIVDFDCPGDGIITSLIEQAPNPKSRITLTDEADSLGLRRVQLDWELNDRDLATIRILAIEVAKEMARLNRARVQLAPFVLDSSRNVDVGSHAHQMGTTRMSADPRYGVVDENCRVHGIQNLFVIGSSVFSTGGGTNPTLTVVMLALRLGDYLSRRI